MKHIVRVERHIVRDILASIIGGGIVVVATQKSWIAGIVTAVAASALFITERADIEEEEEPWTNSF